MVVYMASAGVGITQDASIWGATYYGFIGVFIYALATRIVREFFLLGADERAASAFRVGGLCVFRGVRSLNGSINDTAHMLSWSPSSNLDKSQFKQTIIKKTVNCFWLTNVYMMAVIAVDKFAPGVAQDWYDLWKPAIAVQQQVSYSFSHAHEKLLALGYGDRVDFVFHTFAAPLYISLAYVFFNFKNTLKTLVLEIRNNIFIVFSEFRKNSYQNNYATYFRKEFLVPGVMVTLFVVALNATLVLGSTVVYESIGPNRYLFVFMPQVNRIESMCFAAIFPMVIAYFNLMYVRVMYSNIYLLVRFFVKILR